MTMIVLAATAVVLSVTQNDSRFLSANGCSPRVRLRWTSMVSSTMPSMASATTIRVSEQARDRLNELARAASTTTIDYVDQLVARLDEDELLGRIVDSLNDPTIIEESAVFDGALIDGLDPSDDFSAWR